MWGQREVLFTDKALNHRAGGASTHPLNHLPGTMTTTIIDSQHKSPGVWIEAGAGFPIPWDSSSPLSTADSS